MHHLEINMREHVEAFCTAIRLDHKDLESIGLTRAVLHECVTKIIHSELDRRLKWVHGYSLIVTEPADILAEAIRSVTVGTVNTIGDADVSIQLENNYKTIISTMSTTIDQIGEILSIAIPTPTWATIDVRVIGDRAFIKLGEDFRIADYERLKDIERAATELDMFTTQEEINTALARLKQAYKVPVGRFQL